MRPACISQREKKKSRIRIWFPANARLPWKWQNFRPHRSSCARIIKQSTYRILSLSCTGIIKRDLTLSTFLDISIEPIPAIPTPAGARTIVTRAMEPMYLSPSRYRKPHVPFKQILFLLKTKTVSLYLVPGGAVTFNLSAKGISALTAPEHGSLILKTCRVTGTSPLADTFTLGGSSAIISEDGPPGTPTTS